MKKILFLVVLCFVTSVMAKEIKLTERQAEALRDSLSDQSKISKLLRSNKTARSSTHQKTIVR